MNNNSMDASVLLIGIWIHKDLIGPDKQETLEYYCLYFDKGEFTRQKGKEVHCYKDGKPYGRGDMI